VPPARRLALIPDDWNNFADALLLAGAPTEHALMRRIESLILILALGFYVWFLRRFGFAHVFSYVRLVGWGLALTVALESVARFANTLGWRIVIPNLPRNLGITEMFMARIAGEATDYVTPSAQLGGQFVMALMVRAKLPMAQGLASVAIAALAEGVGQIVFITTAILVSIPFEASVHHHLLWPIVAGMAIAIGLSVGFFFVQMRNPFSWMWKAASRFDVPQLANPEVKAAAAEADQVLKDFYRNHQGLFARACVFYVIAWSMGPVEIYLLMTMLHVHASWMAALVTEALGLLIERATFLIPAKLVSQEGGKALLLSMLGYSVRIGFAIGFLRRLKELVWVMFGLAVLGAHRLLTARQSSAVLLSDHAASRPLVAIAADPPQKKIIEVQPAQRGEFS
jgi:Lysylphosphatidylglycerol synthase TM region